MGWQDAPLASAAPATVAPRRAAPANDEPSVLSQIGWNQAPREGETGQRAIVYDAAKHSADKAAEATRLARRWGVPDASDVFMRTLDEVRHQTAVDEADAALRANPKLARAAARQPSVIRIGHDDVANLSDITKAVQKYGELKAWSGPEPTFESYVRGLAKSVTTRTSAQSLGISGAIADALDSSGLVQFDAVDKANLKRKQAQATGASAYTDPDFKTSTASAIYQGLSSTISQAPGLAASIVTGTAAPALTVMGLQTAAGAYAKYRGRDATPGQAALGAGLESAIEVATELLPMGALLKGVQKKTVAGFLQGLAKSTAAEIPGEQLATLLQDAVDTAIANPDKTWAQYRAERGDAAYQTLIATITQSAVMGGLGAAATATLRRQARDTKAQTQVDNLADMFKRATESKVRERDPETFAQLVQQMSDEGQDAPSAVYVDARRLTEEVLTTPEVQEVFNQMGVSPEQIAEAQATGGAVEIPIGELLAKAAGTPLEQALMPHLRSEHDGLSQVELKDQAKESAEFLQTAMEEEIAKSAKGEEIRTSAEVVYTKVLDQLQSIGRNTKDVNESYAALVKAFYAATSSRLGMTPEQMFEAYPLRIRGETVGPGYTAQDTGPLTVEGYHFSKQDRPTITTGAFGTGLLGSSREEYLNAADKRLSKRAYFYADKGTGINPESGVGGRAHRVQLTNVYDSNKDPLALKKGPGGKLGFESRVLDAGFSGYLDRLGGTQSGQVIMLGDQTFTPELLGAQSRIESGQRVPAMPTVAPKWETQASGEPAALQARLERMLATPGWAGYDLRIEGRELQARKKEEVLEQSSGEAALQRWFGDESTMRNPDGTPRVLYHGTTKKVAKSIQQFKRSAYGAMGPAVYLGDDAEVAAAYDQGAVMQVYARGKYLSNMQWTKYINEHGWDGAEAAATADGWAGVYDEMFENAVAVWDPANIKSVKAKEFTEEGGLYAQSVSTRTPSPKAGRPDPHLSTGLAVDFATLNTVPKFKAKLADVVARYVTSKRSRASVDTRIETFINQSRDNLLWLFDMVPAETRERSKLWYVGGRNIVDRWVKKFDGRYTDAQMAGALAVMSPKMAWDPNVSLSERIVDIYTDQQDTAWSPEMTAVADKVAEKNVGRIPLIDEVRGRKLSEVNSALGKAFWIRFYDEAHNPRGYRLLTPEGGFLPEKATTGKGAEAVAAYGNGFGPIAKVVSILEDGSIPNISRQLGEEHKVRNFYNNIFDPNDPNSVTIDTHAAAAALLLPLGASAPEVGDLFGAAGSNDATGMSGTYVLLAEAYRRAAAQRGVLPREMQSITWEAVRGLFTPAFKTAYAKDSAKFDKLWFDYTHGKATLDDTRQAILAISGNVIPPRWVGSDPGLHEGGWASSYTGELLGLELPRGGDGTAGPGAGGAAAVGVPALANTDDFPTDFVAAVAEYAAIPETNGGQVLNVDLARELSPAYRADRSRSAEVHESASAFVKAMYAQRLAAATPAGKRRTVLFSAGGTGAGKSTGLALPTLAPAVGEAEIVYDTNMSSLASAKTKIDAALAAGREVALVYTFHDPLDALANGALPRAERMGRTVPLAEHLKTHVGARSVVDQLAAAYAGDSRVSIQAIDNSKGRGKAEIVALAKVPKINENGLKEKLNEEVDQQFREGRISAATYRGFTVGRVGLTGGRVDGGNVEPNNSTATSTGQATLDDFSPERVADILTKDGWSILTAENPMGVQADPEANSAAQEALRADLDALGAQYTEAVGKYGQIENSLIVVGITEQQALELGAKYKQDSVLTRNGLQYPDGRPTTRATGVDVFDVAPEDFYTTVPSTGAKFALQLDFGQEEGGAYEQGEQARGTFNPNTLEIALNPNADLSTFLHEAGHFYLEVLAGIAGKPGAPQQIVDDFTKTLKWFGVKAEQDRTAIDVWNGMSLEEKRPYHERWAESFEQFLIEGRAPSLELRAPFQRFRGWMIQVYKSLADFVKGRNLRVSDEVRQVFDRLLATEEQIAEAEQQARYEAIYKSAEEAGMDQFEWAVYQEMHREGTDTAIDEMQARSMADMKWAAAARSKALRQAQAEVKAKRDAMREEVTTEVLSSPLEQARAYIKDQRRSTPEQRDALKDWSDRRAAARERADEQVKADFVAANPDVKGLAKGRLLAANKRVLANQAEALVLEWEKTNPRPTPVLPEVEMDQIAEQFGFSSGDELRAQMLEQPQAKDLIDALTEQRLLETYGELVTQDGIERAANEAVHNDARARFVATELATMQRAMKQTEQIGTTRTGKPISVNVMIRAAKQFAEAIVGRRKIVDLQPGRYTAAERRATEAVFKAQAAGKQAEAVAAQRDRLLNLYAARETMAAQAEVKRAREYLAKFDKATIRAKIPTEYLDQIDNVLEGFDLRASTSRKEIDRTAALAAWVKAQNELGIDPILPDDVLARMDKVSFKALTVEEFRGVVDTVRQIEHLGRLKGRLLVAKDKREFDVIATEIAQSIRDNGGAERPVRLELPGRAEKFFAGAWADHRKLNSLTHQMDGGVDNGPFYRALVRSMNDAGAREGVMLEQATVALAKLYAPIEKLPGGFSGGSVFIPEIKNSLSRGGRLSIALNWGNAQNRQRVMDGDAWTEAQVDAILATLSPVELNFVNDVWAHIDGYWPEIRAKQLRVSGVVEDKVEAEPFVIKHADGTETQMRGGYYPIKYDTDRSIKAERNEAVETAKEIMRGAVARPTTRRGHTKARVEKVINRPVRKDLSVITQHVNQVVHDLAWHEWFIDANRLMNDPRIATAVRDHYGPEIARTMREGIDAIAVGDAVHQGAIDRLLLGLRSNVSRATMGLSMTTALLQPFGLTQSMARIGVVPVLKGAARWAGDAARMESTIGWVNEKSEFMRHRSKTFNRELREISQRVKGKSKVMQIVDASLFMLMQKMQMVADIPTWVGRYEAALNEGLDDSAAVAQADEAVLASQGGGTIKDLAAVQRDHPFLTQFYSYFNTTMNLVVEKTAETDFKNPRAVAGWLGDMALLTVIPAILPALITYLLKGGGEDNEPEDWAKKMLEWQASYMLGMFVLLRELPVVWSPFDYSGPPAGRILNDAKRLAQQSAQGEVDEPLVLAAINFMGTSLGVPTVQLLRSYKGWLAWDEGDAPASSILFGPPPRD